MAVSVGVTATLVASGGVDIRRRSAVRLQCLSVVESSRKQWENFYQRHQNKVFTLSAISPEKMAIVIQNLGLVLKPNGHVLFRDYAIGDYAQIMLMNKNQVISENFYFRGDGTCSFYFSEDLLSKLFERAGFVVVDVNTYNKEIINRARNITMQRRWIRAVFRRP